MRSRWILGICVLALASSLWAGDAWAGRPGGIRTPPDPAALAAKYVAVLTEMGDRCAERNAAVAERFVDQIEKLIAAGNLEEAESLADYGIQRVDSISDRCVRAIESSTTAFVESLQRLEADQATIDSVTDASAAAVDAVVTSQEQATAAIEAALP